MRAAVVLLVLLAVSAAAGRAAPAIAAPDDRDRLVRVDDGLTPATGADEPEAAAAEDDDPAAELAALCDLLVTAADTHAVPPEFFIRLIWKESRFNPNALSPKGAQGIAQFMPGTARARGLKKPFDPAEALPASAAFLKALFDRFGHWGLAAMAYNAGETRVDGYLGGGFLPYETRDYVYAITGRSAEFWRARRAREIERAAREETLNPHPPSDPVAPAVAKPDDPPPAEGGGIVRVAFAGGVVPHAGAAAEIDDLEPVLPPRPRPEDLEGRPVDCTALVTTLGKARTSPRPPGGGGWAPWGAQLAGHMNPSVAMRQFERVRGRMPGDLRGTPPVVIAKRIPGMGRRAVHAVQLGASSRSGAQALCRRIGAAGVPCVVVRN
ncbi:hypothetical protein AB7M35_003276 [Amorphus suaedae]